MAVSTPPLTCSVRGPFCSASWAAFPVFPSWLTAFRVSWETETDPRTPRPYDPANSEDYNTGYVAGSDDDLSDPTQAGWIMATEIAPEGGHGEEIAVIDIGADGIGTGLGRPRGGNSPTAIPPP